MKFVIFKMKLLQIYQVKMEVSSFLCNYMASLYCTIDLKERHAKLLAEIKQLSQTVQKGLKRK